MTKPLLYLLLLFGGAIAAGAGMLGYSEWRSTQQPNVAATPDRQPVAQAPAEPAAPSRKTAAVQTPPRADADEGAQASTAGEPVRDSGTSAAAPPDAGETSPAAEGAASATETPPPAPSPSSEPLSLDTAALQPHESTAASPDAATADSSPDVAAGSGPSFDIVRVEPTGEAVIAGNAPPGARVQVLSNGDVVAEAKADPSGGWVALPDVPLAPGSHDLTIRALTGSGEATQSEQRVAVAVPEQPGEEVLAVLDTPGKPSETLSRASEDGGAQPPQKLDPMATASDAGAAGPQQTAGEAPVVNVDAVEAEGRTMFVAGAGEPGALVRVYVDDELLGEAKAGEGGRWLVEAPRSLEEGEVTIRADQMQAGTAQVEARAEVPFVRRLDMAALVPVARGSAGAAQSAAGEDLPSPSAVIIRRGDNLWTISRRTYGRGVRYTTIYQANQDQIRNPNLIYPGQVFMLPTGDRGWAEN